MYKDVMSLVKMILFAPEKWKLQNISSAWLLSLIYEILATRLQVKVLSCFVLSTYADYFYFLKYEKRQRNHACDNFFVLSD